MKTSSKCKQFVEEQSLHNYRKQLNLGEFLYPQMSTYRIQLAKGHSSHLTEKEMEAKW